MTLGLATGIALSVAAGPVVDATLHDANAQSTGTTAPVQQDGTATGQSVVDVVQQVSPAVVTVINKQDVQFQNGTSSIQPVGSGTGFIIDEDGHIVTNWHVVNGGTDFEVVFSDGTSHEAELIGADSVSDLAVVKI